MTKRLYNPLGDSAARREPDYARAVRALTDQELREELALGYGTEDYQRAVVAETLWRAER